MTWFQRSSYCFYNFYDLWHPRVFSDYLLKVPTFIFLEPGCLKLKLPWFSSAYFLLSRFQCSAILPTRPSLRLLPLTHSMAKCGRPSFSTERSRDCPELELKTVNMKLLQANLMKSSFWGIVFKYFEPKFNIYSEVEEGGKNDNEHDTGVWSVPQKIACPFYIQARCQ